MSIGNFSETSESKNEVNETNESVDNTEKPKNQILETPDSYNDDFDSKLDSKESKDVQEVDNKEQDNYFSEVNGEKKSDDKTSLLDKMMNLFKKKEIESSDNIDKKDDSSSTSDMKKDFYERVKENAPSMEKQAEVVKEWQNKKFEANSETDGVEDSFDTHGEDGERTLWSDAQWRKNHENDIER